MGYGSFHGALSFHTVHSVLQGSVWLPSEPPIEVKLSAASCSENQKFDKRKEPEEQINIQSVPG